MLIFIELNSFSYFKFEFLNETSITNLFANLLARIDFLLPECCDTSVEKEHFKLFGKMYRAKKATANSNNFEKEHFNSICTIGDSKFSSVKTKYPILVTDETVNFYLINRDQIVKADKFLDLIIEKLNLMYSVRQTYSIEGTLWKIKRNFNYNDDEEEEEEYILKCATVFSGGEVVNILLEIKSDQLDHVMKTVFPDLLQPESNVKLVEIPIDSSVKDASKYFGIIIKMIKLNL